MNKHIKTLHLKNFQSHEDTKLDLVPGLNVLLGNSDTGKSAIVRGLRWLFYNEPAGDEFLQRGKKQVEVEAEFYDGSRLKRSRSKSVNAYDLSLPNQETMHFEGFGRNVPQEIIDYFHLKKFPISSSDQLTLNIADQLEGPFLLKEMDSNKANAIGRLVGVHYVDLAQRNVNKDISRINRDKKYQEEQMEALNESREALDYIEEKKKDLDQFKEVINKGKQLEDKKRLFDGYLEEVQELRKENKTLQVELNSLAALDKAKESLDGVKGKFQDLSLRKEKKQSYDHLRKEVGICEKDLYELRNLDKTQTLCRDLSKEARKLLEIRDLQDRLNSTNDLMMKEEALLKKLEPLDALQKATMEKSSQCQELKTYRDLNKAYRDIELRKKKAKDYMAQFNNLDQGIETIKDVSKKATQITYLVDLVKTYKDLRSNMRALEEERVHYQGQVKADEGQLKDYLSQLDVCPICKRPMDKHTIESIVHDRV